MVIAWRLYDDERKAMYEELRGDIFRWWWSYGPCLGMIAWYSDNCFVASLNIFGLMVLAWG